MPIEYSLPYAEYAARPGLSSSALKVGTRSMLHMQHYITHGRSDTPSLRWGRLVHRAVLEPSRQFAVFDGPRRAGAAWEAFKAAHDEDDIIKEDEAAKLATLSGRVRCHGHAGMLLRNVKTEASCFWTDPILGPCKCRIDAYDPARGIVEIKTARSIATRDFANACAQLAYDIQVGWYAWVAVASGLFLKPPSVNVIAIESAPPHDVRAYSVGDAILEKGLEKARAIALAYRAAEATSTFAGVCEDVLAPLELPAWYGGTMEGLGSLNLEGVDDADE